MRPSSAPAASPLSSSRWVYNRAGQSARAGPAVSLGPASSPCRWCNSTLCPVPKMQRERCPASRGSRDTALPLTSAVLGLVCTTSPWPFANSCRVSRGSLPPCPAAAESPQNAAEHIGKAGGASVRTYLRKGRKCQREEGTRVRNSRRLEEEMLQYSLQPVEDYGAGGSFQKDL